MPSLADKISTPGWVEGERVKVRDEIVLPSKLAKAVPSIWPRPFWVTSDVADVESQLTVDFHSVIGVRFAACNMLGQTLSGVHSEVPRPHKVP